MQIPTEWLEEFVELPNSTEKLTRDLTRIGLEVDGVNVPGDRVNGLKIIDILSVEPHPNNDDLTVCEISDDGGKSTVVSAASNLGTNGKYVWAPPGSSVDNRTIETENLDGVPSEGMLCSLEELGLTSSSSALLKLSDQAVTGSAATETLKLDRPILELDLTPNRADCLSLIGVARDYATFKDVPLTLPETKELDVSDTSSPNVSIEAPKRCNQYYGLSIRDVPEGSSPLWIQRRLAHMGLQPRHIVVDATNYVLFEQGNPLHAFDLDRLESPITVKNANDGVSFTTIDDTELELDGEDLVIADSNQPQALAGIMGGAISAVTDSTTDIFLEGAHFSSPGIRRTSQRHKLHTDSSHRFERGVDSENILPAMTRFVELLTEASGDPLNVDQPTKVIQDQHGTDTISFDPDSFESLIGFSPETPMETTLTKLGCETDTTGNTWQVTPPSFRHDLSRSEDLVEELLRMEGYDTIASNSPTLSLDQTPVPEFRLGQTVRETLSTLGFDETVTFSFHAEDEYRFEPVTDPIKLRNPLSKEHGVLRQTLLDTLLPVLEDNLEAGESRVSLFEIGHVFRSSGEEPLKLSMLTTGPMYEERWDDYEHSQDYYDLKGTLEVLLKRTGFDVPEFVPEDRDGMKQNRNAILTQDDTKIGWIGELADDLIQVDHNHPIYGAEIDLSTLPEPEKTSYNPYSRQPYVKRDLDLVVDADQYARDLRKSIEESARWLEKLEIFDLYRGDPLPDNKKSISFRLYFRASERTLEDTEVNEIQENILNTLRETYGASLRDE
jgi:phenylalanyl-tRNA synthetase beta chain